MTNVFITKYNIDLNSLIKIDRLATIFSLNIKQYSPIFSFLSIHFNPNNRHYLELDDNFNKANIIKSERTKEEEKTKHFLLYHYLHFSFIFFLLFLFQFMSQNLHAEWNTILKGYLCMLKENSLFCFFCFSDYTFYVSAIFRSELRTKWKSSLTYLSFSSPPFIA